MSLEKQMNLAKRCRKDVKDEWKTDISKEVFDAFSKVDRKFFILTGLGFFTYSDKAAPTHCGQTISMPSFVMAMTELLKPEKGGKYFEVGCGSGFQACVLLLIAENTGKVTTIERYEKLVDFAQKNITSALKEINREDLLNNIEIVHGDAFEEVKKHSQLDGIIVTAQTITKTDMENFCSKVRGSLKIGGRIIIPVYKGFDTIVYTAKKQRNGKMKVMHRKGLTHWVPMKHGIGGED